jgi:DNA primase
MEPLESAKEEIKQAADIVEVIGQYVQLKRAGQNYVGICPFHGDKDPSFTVNQGKQLFHCFGCKVGGDLFAFWMAYHQVTFPQAMEDLAEKYHVALPKVQWRPGDRKMKAQKEAFTELNDLAATYFHGILLKSSKGIPGREYFRKRGLSEHIISEHRLGYAPDEWEGLTGWLRSREADLKTAAQAGLIIPRKNKGYYDRFRGRVLFPIFNASKRIVGFGGRVLDETLPKYMNTPETDVFHKGELLYGLDSGLPSIRKSGRALLVEGYMDVLALREHGFDESLATLGTALTEHHVRTIKGFVKEVVVIFDSDTAGRTAAIKGLPLFARGGVSAKALVLPEGEDPDSLVQKEGIQSFLDRLTQAVPLFDFFLEHRLSGQGDTVEAQIDVMNQVLPILADLDHPAQRAYYVHRLAERSDLGESVIMSELERWKAHKSTKVLSEDLTKRLPARRRNKGDDHHLLNLVVHHPEAMERLTDSGCRPLFSSPDSVALFEALYAVFREKGVLKPPEILKQLEGRDICARFREVMLMPSIYEGSVDQAIEEFEAKACKLTITAAIVEAKKRGDSETLNQLLVEKRQRADEKY